MENQTDSKLDLNKTPETNFGTIPPNPTPRIGVWGDGTANSKGFVWGPVLKEDGSNDDYSPKTAVWG